MRLRIAAAMRRHPLPQDQPVQGPKPPPRKAIFDDTSGQIEIPAVHTGYNATTRSISTSAPTASAVTPTQVLAGSPPGGKLASQIAFMAG